MKNHHYIPQIYLRRFTDPKRYRDLWQFSLDDGTVLLSTPKKSGCRDYYHSLQTNDGRDDESIERSFHLNENRLPLLFKSVHKRQNPGEDGWWTLFWMVALHMVRVPKFQDAFGKAASQVYQHVYSIYSHSPEFYRLCERTGMSPEAARDMRITAAPDTMLCISLDSYKNLITHLNRMSWSFLYSPPGTHFFTSDAPVVLWVPPDRRKYGSIGLLTPECELFFPLGRSVCAVANHQPRSLEPYRDVTEDELAQINQRILFEGYKYIYGPTDSSEIRDRVNVIAKSRSTR